MEILVVEDEPRMAALLKRGFTREGHVVEVAGDGATALDHATTRAFDVIVLDVMLPAVDGLEVVRRLRRSRCPTPILLLTARDLPRDIVRGLDLGADDYLTKPFAFEELLARTRAVARRGSRSGDSLISEGDLSLDPASRRVRRGALEIELTKREFQLLELFLRRAGRVLTREAIISAVWGGLADIEPNTVDVFVGALRRKIDHPGTPALLHTIRGVGFTLRAPDS